MSYGLVKMAKVVDWDRFEEVFGKTYCALSTPQIV
jgi:hypothetical protein